MIYSKEPEFLLAINGAEAPPTAGNWKSPAWKGKSSKPNLHLLGSSREFTGVYYLYHICVDCSFHGGCRRARNVRHSGPSHGSLVVGNGILQADSSVRKICSCFITVILPRYFPFHWPKMPIHHPSSYHPHFIYTFLDVPLVSDPILRSPEASSFANASVLCFFPPQPIPRNR